MSTSALNHHLQFEGSPYVRRRAKSQAFCLIPPETLQIRLLQIRQNRRISAAFSILHGRLANLLKACRRDELGLRDAALMRIAYDTAARRSELVAIDVAHIEGPDGEGAGLLHIPSSKTDRNQEGVEAYLSPATMAAIARWRKAGEIVRDHCYAG